MTRILRLACVLVFLLIIGGTTSQPSHAQWWWGATLWFSSPGNAFLESANPLGSVATLPLPQTIIPPGDFFTFGVAASTDNRYVAHQAFDPDTSTSHLYFGATVEGFCCTDVRDLVDNVEAFNLGGFEPDGSRFAFSYVLSGQPFPPPGGIMIVDAATGTIVADMPMESINAAIGGPNFGVWATMGEWTTDGIRFAPNCYACEGNFEDEYSLWQPGTGSFVPNSGVFFSAFGDRLEATSELLYLEQDTRFSYDPTPGMFAVPNVIQYYADGNFDGASSVVYADPSVVSIFGAHWVGDGQAIVVEEPNGSFWDVVFRDGRRSRVSGLVGAQVVGGTPEGWFAVVDTVANQTEGRAVYHFSLETLQPTLIRTVTENQTVLIADIPALGSTIESPTFAAVPDPTGPAIAQCPGFLPSRLAVGQQASVTPGDPNRLRVGPSTVSNIIGEIPGGATFTVLEGPACDTPENGIAWWRVNYQGNEGWTAEGQGQSYWTVPGG